MARGAGLTSSSMESLLGLLADALFSLELKPLGQEGIKPYEQEAKVWLVDLVGSLRWQCDSLFHSSVPRPVNPGYQRKSTIYWMCYNIPRYFIAYDGLGYFYGFLLVR